MAVVLNEKVGRWEHSHQVHSVNVKSWKLVTTMKKRNDEIFVTIDGPDEAKARECFNTALHAGLIAAIAAAYVGAGLGAAEVGFAAAKAMMVACLGDAYSVALREEGQWEYWEL